MKIVCIKKGVDTIVATHVAPTKQTEKIAVTLLGAVLLTKRPGERGDKEKHTIRVKYII